MSLFLTFVIVVNQGRMLLITLLMVFIVFILVEKPIKRSMLNLSYMAVLVVASVVILYLLVPSYIEGMYFMFVQMFSALSGDITDDPFSNARVLTATQIVDYFSSRPETMLFGVGNLSHQYNRGFESVFGYFYPVDVGILGGVFVYGIIGFLFIFVIPVLYLIKAFVDKDSNNNRDSDESQFHLSLKYMLIFASVHIAGGNFYFNIMYYIIPLFLLHAYQKKMVKNSIESKR